MFCSKCGKEINDGAAFCDKCGSSLNPSEKRNGEGSGRMSDEEEKQKKSALWTFLLGWGILLGILAIMFLIDFEMLFDSPQDIADLTVGMLMLLGGFIVFACETIMVFRLPMKKRSFDSAKSRMKLGVAMKIIIPIGYALYLKIAFDVGPTMLACAMFGVSVLLNIVSAVLYTKAANEEFSSKYKENHSTNKLLNKIGAESPSRADWICRHCGRTNKSIDNFCKDCGKYK